MIRNSCAFCGYERGPHDTNHAPHCHHWEFYGPCYCGYPHDRTTHNTHCNPTTLEHTMTDLTEPTDLARRLAQAENAYPYSADTIPDGHLVRVLHNDERLEHLDLTQWAPAPSRAKGTATLYDPTDFLTYLDRLTTPATTLWADNDRTRITAVLNDHTTGTDPGWRDHRIVLQLRPDPEWSAWVGRDKYLSAQGDFAEFIEDHIHAIVTPDPATMLEVATSFQAHRTAEFERGTRLASGDVQLRYVETTTATAGTKGQLDVPETFTLQLTPYLGIPPITLPARLRYRITRGELAIGYALHRPDRARDTAFDQVRALISDHTPVHLGSAPQPELR